MAGHHHSQSLNLNQVRLMQGSPRITYEGQSVFWKDCPYCMQSMPHIRRDDDSECAVCGFRSSQQEQEQR